MNTRELFGIAQVVRRSTTNRDVLTICDALIDRLMVEIADRADPVIVAAAQVEAHKGRSKVKAKR